MGISAHLRILNGRTLGDSNGKFTCHRPLGSNVVDYLIVSEELLSDILYFPVHPFKGTFSDCHCKITSIPMLPQYSVVKSVMIGIQASLQCAWNKSSRESLP